MRGAVLSAGGRSEALAELVDKKLFAHGRAHIAGWSKVHDAKFGAGSWE